MQEEQVKDETENFLVATTDAPVEQKPQDETKETEEVATSDDENAESKEEPIADGEVEKPKKKSRSQRRIETLSAEKNKANDRVAELEAQIANKNSDSKSGDIDPADFETYEEYEVALNTPKQSKQPTVNPDYAKAMESLQDKFDEGAEKYSDFDEKIQNKDLRITESMVMAFDEVDNATDTAYYYASNPNEAEKVSKMTAVKQVNAVTRKSKELSKKPLKKVTNAPDPIEPVGSGGDYTKPMNELSFKDFEERRNSEASARKFW